MEKEMGMEEWERERNKCYGWNSYEFDDSSRIQKWGERFLFLFFLLELARRATRELNRLRC